MTNPITPETVHEALAAHADCWDENGKWIHGGRETSPLEDMAPDLARAYLDAMRELAVYEGASNTHFSATGMVDEMVDRLVTLEKENARFREALSLYSCEDGCNDCPEHERDRVSCGWTASADLPPTDEQIMAHPKVVALVEAAEAQLAALDAYTTGIDGIEWARVAMESANADNDLRAALRDLKGGEW